MTLVLDTLRHAFGRQRVLEGASLTVRPGSITGLFGRNASGKSTLMRIAAAQLRPDSGAVLADGVPLARGGRRRWFGRIAYLPQERMLPSEAPVSVVARAFPGGAARLADELVAPLRGRRVGQLSTGERQTLRIALVTSLRRDYYVLDEPIVGLQPTLVEEILSRLGRLAAGGAGILLSDHRIDDVSPLVGSSYVLANGRCRPHDATDLRAGLTARPWD